MEYTEVYLRIPEPYSGKFAVEGNLLQATVGGHTYDFERTISDEERTTFVTNQEALCRILEEEGLSTAGFTFYILADYPNRADSENSTGYYGLDAMTSWEQVLTTIQVCLGDYTNYGYLYALSNRVAADLQWACDDAAAEHTQVFVDDPSLLNLVYPCFSEKYSDVDSIAACRALAVALLANAENIWSEIEFLKAREVYAQSRAIDFEPTYITFAYHGGGCPLKLACQYLEVFWDYTFVASNECLDGIIPVDYTADVRGLIHTFEWLDVQLTPLCEKFDAVPDQRVQTQMMESLPREMASQYIRTGGRYRMEAGEGRIWATTVTALAHEYVHYIYWLVCGEPDPDHEQWHSEAVAHYYTVGQRYEYRHNFIKNVDPSYRERLEANIGEAYDEFSDYIKLLRIEWRKQELEYVYYLKGNYDLACAFGEYFVRTYGDDIFLNSMMYPSRVKEFTGFTMDEIVDAWIADMRNLAND